MRPLQLPRNYHCVPGDWFGEYTRSGQKRHLKALRSRARRRWDKLVVAENAEHWMGQRGWRWW